MSAPTVRCRATSAGSRPPPARSSGPCATASAAAAPAGTGKAGARAGRSTGCRICWRRHDAAVLVVEGEKAADAAAAALPDMVVVSPMNGAQSPHRTDWRSVAGRSVVIWPDADEPGARFARKVGQLAKDAGASEVADRGRARGRARRLGPGGRAARRLDGRDDRPAPSPRPSCSTPTVRSRAASGCSTAAAMRTVRRALQAGREGGQGERRGHQAMGLVRLAARRRWPTPATATAKPGAGCSASTTATARCTSGPCRWR